MTSVTSPETEEDIVPLLRSDLVIKPSPQSRGTRDVTDPLSNKTFALYDFEVSIARMLDGKRTAGAVINAANRIGIPVTLPTLRTFLSQLRAYQFIDTSAPATDSTTWEPRRKWTAEARELYQSALRLLRSGKFDDARGYADALLAADPDNEEIGPLRARIDAAAAGNGDLNAPFDENAAPASSAPMAIEDESPPLPVPSLGVTQTGEPEALPFESSASSISIEATAPLAKLMSSSLGVTEPSVATTPAPRTTSLPTLPLEVTQAVAAPLPTDHLPPLDPHATIPAMPVAPEVTDPIAAPIPDNAQTMEPLPPVAEEEAAPEKPAAPKKKSKLPLIIAVVAVLAIAGVLLRPVEARVTLPCELKTVTLGTANAPRAGTVKQADVNSGEFVAKGAIIARLEVSLDNGPATLAAKQTALEQELAALGRPPPAAKVKKAKAAVKKAELAVKSAEKAATKAKGKKVALAAKTLENKEAALKKAQAAFETLTHEQKRAELKAAIDELGSSGDSAKDAMSRSVIEAPVDGVVLLPELPATVEENAPFAQLVEAKLAIETTGAIPEGATKATLKLGTIERPVPVQNGKATVTLDPALVKAKGELIFPGRKQPWVMSLMGQ